MINNVKCIQSEDLVTLCDIAKSIKASYAAYFIIDDDTIIAYGSQDFMLSSLSRIIVPNTTKLHGSIAVYMKEDDSFTKFCKQLVPFTDVKYNISSLTAPSGEVINTPILLEQRFQIKKNSLNDILGQALTTFEIPEESVASLRATVSSMKSTSKQEFYEIAPGYIITIYAGYLPTNKSDQLKVSVISSDNWFMCKYEIFKKKCNKIDIFVKYRRI